MPFTPKQAASIVLTGLGQVMLQESAVTGGFFLAGLAAGAWIMAAGALLGVIAATLTAALLKFPEKNISAGLYGYNAALIGVGMLTFFSPSVPLFGLIMAGSVASAIVVHLQLLKFPLPAFTSAFVVLAWGLFWVARTLNLDAAIHSSFTAMVHEGGLLRGVGQVMFQQSALSGLLFLIGIFFNSRPHGFWALGGSAIGIIVAAALHCPLDLIFAGLFGYNAVLCAIALSGRTWREAAAPVAACILSVVILLAFQRLNLPALTAPFVLAGWLFVYIRRRYGWPVRQDA